MTHTFVKPWMLWIIPVLMSIAIFVGYPYVFKPIHNLESSYTADGSLEESIAFSDMIVYGKITKQRVVDHPGDHDGKMIEYSIEPIEVLHSIQGRYETPIRMLSYTGIFPRMIVKDERSPILRVGDTALFLIGYTGEYYFYSDSMLVSETGVVYPHPDVGLPPTKASQLAKGDITLAKIRELVQQVPRADFETRMKWAAQIDAKRATTTPKK